jgi:hypothetical protein
MENRAGRITLGQLLGDVPDHKKINTFNDLCDKSIAMVSGHGRRLG